MRTLPFDARLLGLSALGLSIVIAVHRESAGQQPASELAPQIEALQRERVETLRQLVQLTEAHYEAGIIGENSLIRAMQNLLDAELDLAREPQERIAIRQSQLELIERLEAAVAARFEDGVSPQSDLLTVQAERMLAEINLLKEQSAE